jgi:arylsulfatase A-like enzyme
MISIAPVVAAPCAQSEPDIIPARSSTTSARMKDMLTTLLAAVGDTSVKEDLLKGKKLGDTTYKVHLDGYNLMPALKGEGEWPRKEFLYWTDTGNTAALRYNDWKVTFPRQNAHGLQVWQEPLEELGAPVLCNLRTDRGDRTKVQ